MAAPGTAARERKATESSGKIPKSLSGMPADLLSDAARRLGWVGLIYAMVFSMVYFVPRLSIGSVGELFSLPQAWVAGISILLGLTVFVYSKRPDVPAK